MLMPNNHRSLLSKQLLGAGLCAAYLFGANAIKAYEFELGTLFFTPAERQAAQYATVITPTAPAARPAIPIKKIVKRKRQRSPAKSNTVKQIRLDGTIHRSQGSSMYWINGQLKIGPVKASGLRVGQSWHSQQSRIDNGLNDGKIIVHKAKPTAP